MVGIEIEVGAVEDVSLRLAPDLHFVLDNSNKYGSRIDVIMKKHGMTKGTVGQRLRARRRPAGVDRSMRAVTHSTPLSRRISSASSSGEQPPAMAQPFQAPAEARHRQAAAGGAGGRKRGGSASAER